MGPKQSFKCPKCDKNTFRDAFNLGAHVRVCKGISSRTQTSSSKEAGLSQRVDDTAEDTAQDGVNRIPPDTSDGDRESPSSAQETPQHSGDKETDEEAGVGSEVAAEMRTDGAGPSSSSCERDNQAIDFVLSTDDTSKIRKTSENPPRVAVLDLIAVITGQHEAARMVYKRLVGTYAEVRAICYDYKFKGRGQQFTPVTNAKGAVMIINALPGKVASRLRIEWADIIVRYLGGDLTLVQEIAHNRDIQDDTPDDHPLRFFGQDVESRVLPQSVTGIQDMRRPQVYLGYAGPPEDWTDIKRSDGTPFVPREDQLIFKFGQNDFNTSRNATHTREYGTWQVIDSVLTDNPPKVERATKDELKNRNDLLSALHKNKTRRDTEVVAANQSEYKAVVEKIVEIAARCKITELNMDFERELTKRLEFESRKTEAESQAKLADARMAEASVSVRLLELQIELKRLEMALP